VCSSDLGSNRIFGHLGGCSRPINNSAADRRGRKGTFTPPYNIMFLLTFTLGICAAGSPKRPKKLRKALTGFPSDTYLLASAAATSNPVKKTKHSDSYLGIGWRSAQNLKGSPMAWFFTVVILIVAAFLVILFLNRYYRKATREISVVRTGMGGQKVVLDGGCLALPFLHKVAEVNMRTSKLEIERLGPKSIITRDRLRVDISAEFYVRVQATVEGVATAAQALAGKSFRAADLEDILEGKLVDAMLSVAARYTMDELQDDRAGYAREITEILSDNLAQNGLMLESVSLSKIDQTPFHALDENNAFNALGMRRLAEIIAVNKKERAVIEADADVAVRQSHLDATKSKIGRASCRERV